jgi:hypothetical protein
MDRCNTKKRRKPKLAIKLRVEIFTNLEGRLEENPQVAISVVIYDGVSVRVGNGDKRFWK